MNIADIVDLALTQTGTAINTTNQELALKYLNIGKNNFWSYILGENTEGTNGENWTKVLISGKEWYNTPEVASDKTGSKKLDRLYISYDGEIYNDTSLLKYTPATEVSPSVLPYDWNYYLTNQEKNNPIYYWNDNKIFIAPLPDLTIQQGLRLTGFKNIPNYTLSTLECQTKIPNDYHDVLLQYVIYRLYEYKLDTNRKIAEKQEYERMRDDAVKNLSSKIVKPFQISYPEDRGDNYLDFKQI